MSKLDGNERWKGKMLLTEHKERYEERKQPRKLARPLDEEMIMIRDYIVLPHIISMVQRCVDEMHFIKISLKPFLMRCLEYIMARVTSDYYELKKELGRRNISVTATNTDDDIMFFRYTCRGYENTFGIVREALKSEIRIRITAYTQELGDKIKSPGS